MKNLEALLRGYLFFKVNGKFFLAYSTAKAARVATTGNVEFVGWHIFKGWRCFFKRIVT